MNKIKSLGVLFVVLVSACSSEGAKRSAYEALYQKDCMDRTGIPHCDQKHPSYDEYRRDVP